jgi:hypothetical protein
MLQGLEEFGLGNRHAQHRHLQARKPDTDHRGNPVFGQDALEHQGHDFNRRFFGGRGGGLLELGGALAQGAHGLVHLRLAVDLALRVRKQGALRAGFFRAFHAGHGLRQLRRGLVGPCVVETRHLVCQQALELAHHALRPHARPGQRRGGGLHAGFVIHPPGPSLPGLGRRGPCRRFRRRCRIAGAPGRPPGREPTRHRPERPAPEPGMPPPACRPCARGPPPGFRAGTWEPARPAEAAPELPRAPAAAGAAPPDEP